MDAASDPTYSIAKESEERALKLGIPAPPHAISERFNPMQAVLDGAQKPEYAKIRVPALAFYAAPRSWEELMPGAPAITDPQKRKLAEQVFADVAAARQQMEDAFRNGVANSRAIELPDAGHYIFRSSEVEVVREILTFLQRLD